MKDKKETICVWFSNGAASAVAAKLTVEKYKETHNLLIVNNPIMEEHHDNLRFKKEVQEWIQHPIIDAINPKFPSCSIVDVFEKIKWVSGIGGASCTLNLKKQARYNFELNNDIDWHVLGFTLEEKDRHDRFVIGERSNVIPILINEKITKYDCFDILHKAGIRRPDIYEFGFPNANCIGCVKSSSPSYWNLVRKHFPDVFNQSAEQTERLNCRIVKYKGNRIFLSQLSINARGGKIPTWECGLFCDTE
jgi:hypothetical protein